MKLSKLRMAMSVVMTILVLATLYTARGEGGGGGSRALGSLKAVPIPTTDLSGYLKSGSQAKAAAVALGKALFWDMQAGGDGNQACASCHFNAGADSRTKGQMHPSADGSFQGGIGANYIPSASDYPFHKLADVNNRNSQVLSDAGNVTGSQGLYHTAFSDVAPGSAEDSGSVITQAAAPDVYGVADASNPNVMVNTRRTTGRNTPPVVNAVFTVRNFWDGRAQNTFNGVSPIGTLDSGAFLLASNPNSGKILVSSGQPAHQIIRIANAALASQAVGPPNNPVEMSYDGRTWKKLGKKMLSLLPLAKQTVAVDDGVLGSYSKQVSSPGSNGMNTTYAALIQQAFQPKWWNSDQLVDENGNFIMTTVSGHQVIKTGAPTSTGEYTLMEYNFSLFWGLAIQLYESTLVSDDSRFDQFMEGNNNALTALEQKGLGVFTGKGNCATCHMGPEFTDASVANLPFASSGKPGNPAPGFHNIGVRPVSEIIATGSGAPGAITTATKTPSLRNIALTAPFLHNGGQLTLEEVVQFYSRGGDFGQRGTDVDNNINSFGFSADDAAALVAFLKSLTDQRVVNQSAPFDHPSLDVPNGAQGDQFAVTQNGATGNAVDDAGTMLHIPAIGKTGTSTPFVPYAQGIRP